MLTRINRFNGVMYHYMNDTLQREEVKMINALASLVVSAAAAVFGAVYYSKFGSVKEYHPETLAITNASWSIAGMALLAGIVFCLSQITCRYGTSNSSPWPGS